MIRGAADEHFWSETYDRAIGDVLALQSDVAQSIAEKVEVTVTGQEHSRLVAARPVSPEVYESYLKGQFGAHNNRAEIEESITYFEEAIRKDPTFAPAYLGLAGAYENLSLILVGASPGEMRPKVISAARKALELDPLGTTGIKIGWILFNARRYDEALRELRSVLAIHPDSAFAHWYLGFALIGKGQPEEAIPELERTASLMHRSPGSLELLATAEAHAGHRAEVLRLIGELKQNQRKGYVPAGALINPYLALRDYNEVFSWFERAYAEQSGILQFLKVHPFFDPLRGDPRFEDLVRRVGLK